MVSAFAPAMATAKNEKPPRERSSLEPGVKKAIRDMTPLEMRRKGSWAVRFYGRGTLPPLVDDAGRPTRFALSAAAWGEPVPRTVAAARRIAAKGRRLLEAYERGRMRWAARTGITNKRRAA